MSETGICNMHSCYIQRSWDNFPGTNFFSGKIESSNEGRVHRILKQVAELRLRSVVFFGNFSASEIGQLGEKGGGGQMLQKWLLGSIWCVFICSPLKICKKVAQTSPQQIWGLFSQSLGEKEIEENPANIVSLT